MTNIHLSLDTHALEALKNTSKIEDKYELLLNFNSNFDAFDTPEFKNADNLFEGCTVRTWLFKINDKPLGYSESRLINGLLYLVIFNIHNHSNIEEIIEYYNIGFFYSNIRISSLQKVFNYLTTINNS
jgi:sulfur transfer protein SufE